MALSGTIYGTFSGTSTSNVRPAIKWSASQNVEGNYSNVTATLVIYRYNTRWQSWNANGCNTSISINGNKSTASRTFDIRNVSSGSYDTVWTRTVKVNHNNDGSKRVNINASISTGVNLGTGSVNGNVYLDDIPRASSFSLSSKKINFGDELVINIKRASTNFTHYTKISFMGKDYWLKNLESSSDTKIRLRIPIDWLNKMPNSSSTTARLVVHTETKGSKPKYIGNGATTITLVTPSNIKPHLSVDKLKDHYDWINDRFGAYVQNKSKVETSMSASGAYGSTIKVKRITLDGQTSTGSSASFKVPKPGTRTITYKVTDSRGRSTSLQRQIKVLPYEGPKSKFSVNRCTSNGVISGSGEYAKLHYDLSAQYMNGRNNIKMYYRHRPSGGYWSSHYEIDSVLPSYIDEDTRRVAISSQILSWFDSSKSYEFEVTVSDSFDTYKLTAPLDTGFTTISFLHGGKGVTIGKEATKEGVQVEMDVFKHLGKDVLSGNKNELPGNAQVINGSADLHNYKTPGYYYIESDEAGRNISNMAPPKDAGALIVYKTGAGVNQIYSGWGLDRTSIYINSYYDRHNKWYGWHRMGES